MSYRVKIDSFEGPFDLLLTLVTQQKVKIGSISVSEVADQYLEHIQEMREIDPDVASEFLIVASTLLNMKARSLLPKDEEPDEVDEELAELTVEQAADLLAERVIVYYQYKRISAMLGSRMRNEAFMHPRQAGPDPEFLGLLPDYLEGVSIDGLAVICASLMARRETFLMDAEHIAAKPMAVELFVDSIAERIAERRKASFEELIDEPGDTAHVVVSFLAILEMYRRGMIDLSQDEPGASIQVSYIDPALWKDYAAPDEEDGDAQGEEDDAAQGDERDDTAQGEERGRSDGEGADAAPDEGDGTIERSV